MDLPELVIIIGNYKSEIEQDAILQSYSGLISAGGLEGICFFGKVEINENV